MFPEIAWVTVPTTGPVTVATSGMSPEMGARFALNVEQTAARIDQELGGVDGAAACLTVPDAALDVADLVPVGQRLHVAVFGEEKVFVLAAVEIRFIDDAIAFGLPHIALWDVADDLGLPDGYPEPLASTISHWYLARQIDRLERYHAELRVALFLDDPNPDQRTPDQATRWVAAPMADPRLFDPQFVASPMGDFIDYAVRTQGVAVLRDPSQDTWGALEREWRIAMKDELLEGREGSYGAEWGVAIFVGFIVLAVLLALLRRRQKRRAAARRPTPPADESLFESAHGSGGESRS
jgi:hypothetical protein